MRVAVAGAGSLDLPPSPHLPLSFLASFNEPGGVNMLEKPNTILRVYVTNLVHALVTASGLVCLCLEWYASRQHRLQA